MKHITRLVLAFAIAAIACLSPMAHADVAPTEPGVNSVRYYLYGDPDGQGTMVMKDGPRHPNGKWIYVAIYQNGYTFYGQGWRSLSGEQTNWTAYCEFWVYGGGVKAKFTGYIAIKPSSGAQGGYYYLNGTGSPYPWDTIPK